MNGKFWDWTTKFWDFFVQLLNLKKARNFFIANCADQIYTAICQFFSGSKKENPVLLQKRDFLSKVLLQLQIWTKIWIWTKKYQDFDSVNDNYLLNEIQWTRFIKPWTRTSLRSNTYIAADSVRNHHITYTQPLASTIRRPQQLLYTANATDKTPIRSR